jgi:glucosamine kinase
VSDAESVTMAALLAVDAGGTSTRVVVLDRTGGCRGVGLAGPGNPVSAGWPAASAAVVEATVRALAAGGVEGRAVERVVVAMAGGGHGGPGRDAAMLGAGLGPLGVTAVPTVENDLLAQYFSGTPVPDGYALVAGTGAAAIRVEDGAVVRTADGLGWLLGDAGSGFWIGHAVVRTVLAAAEGRGPATALAALLAADVGLPDPLEGPDFRRGLLELLYAQPPVHLARFAPLAFVPDGDEVADGIVAGAAAALCDTLTAVLRDDLDGPVVLGGSVLLHQARLRDRVAGRLASLGRGTTVHLVPDGLLGAAVLALRRAGVVVDHDVFARVEASLSGCR